MLNYHLFAVQSLISRSLKSKEVWQEMMMLIENRLYQEDDRCSFKKQTKHNEVVKCIMLPCLVALESVEIEELSNKHLVL